MLKLRSYQQRVIDLALSHIDNYPDSAPTIVVPTGGGKSLISAALATHYAKVGNVLIVTFRKELVAQTAEEMPHHLNVSVFSAGIGRKETKGPIIVAGIQSVRKHWHKLPRIHTLIIDEIHWGNAAYKEFIDNVRKHSPAMRVMGMTASPFDGRGVHLHMLREPITTGVCAEVSMGELLRDGFLCNVVSYQAPTRLDVSGVGIDSKTGDYKQNELQAAVDTEDQNQKVAADILRIFAERKSVLVFASGVEHAQHLAALLPSSKVIVGTTPKVERDTIVEQFRAGKIRWLVAVDTLLVGFNAPRADGLALCRPTKSPLIYVQAIGRVMRTHPTKADALLCDFVGAVEEHGPVDEVVGHPPRVGGGDAPTKFCEACFHICLVGVRKCPNCGQEFPPPVPGERVYDPRTGQIVISGVIIGDDGSRTYPVERVEYRTAVTRAGDNALVADYYAPNRPNPVASSYFNLWHRKQSVVSKDAATWLRRLTLPGGVPTNVNEALMRANFGALKVPSTVTVQPGSAYPVRFGPAKPT
ncbi:MAG: DEAD/DEAH box helicase [Candidatus Cloacimonetes bacterium]|nr:DEAD/DEAH box helicase [Candidatus Cloacimonadota bacterium]